MEMTTKGTLGDEALVTFFQALAVTIWNFDDVPPEQRNRENFLRALDGYLGVVVEQAESEGSDIRGTVDLVRALLDKGLDQMRLLKTGGTEQ